MGRHRREFVSDTKLAIPLESGRRIANHRAKGTPDVSRIEKFAAVLHDARLQLNIFRTVHAYGEQGARGYIVQSWLFRRAEYI